MESVERQRAEAAHRQAQVSLTEMREQRTAHDSARQRAEAELAMVQEQSTAHDSARQGVHHLGAM